MREAAAHVRTPGNTTAWRVLRSRRAMSGTRVTANATDWARWMRGLGEQVLRVREFLGFSQEQLARIAGVSQGAVSRLENGRGVATPLLVVTKVSAALRTALGRVDPELLSDEAR